MEPCPRATAHQGSHFLTSIEKNPSPAPKPQQRTVELPTATHIDLSSVKLTFSLLFPCGANAIHSSLAAAAAWEAAVPEAVLGHACSSSLLLHKPTRLLTTYSLTCTNSSRDSTEKGKLHHKPKFGKKRPFLSDSKQCRKPKTAFSPPFFILEATPWAWTFWVPKTGFMLGSTDMNCAHPHPMCTEDELPLGI